MTENAWYVLAFSNTMQVLFVVFFPDGLFLNLEQDPFFCKNNKCFITANTSMLLLDNEKLRVEVNTRATPERDRN